MRPSRCIGYEHDALGMHLVKIGSLLLAESELRRAVWLNPFERRFAKHLAWCLYRKGERGEARDWALRALAGNGGDEECRELLRMIEAQKG
jgi:Flp pilus assembly protein TadD